MMKQFVTIGLMITFLSGCAVMREQERREALSHMTTDQKVDYLVAENEKLARQQRHADTDIAMAKFFPHMFWGR